jgi:hypothetical protein
MSTPEVVNGIPEPVWGSVLRRNPVPSVIALRWMPRVVQGPHGRDAHVRTRPQEHATENGAF